LKPGPVWRVDLGLESGRVDEKIEKAMIWCDLTTWQNLVATR